jgi:hypothetical protein
MRNRYRINTAAIESRTWTRLMGFVTGMAMVLTGCFFILAKLREGYKASGEAAGTKGALETNSPGLVLATGGAVLICVSLVVQGDVKDTDASVYLPRLVEYVAPSTNADTKPSAPAPTESVPNRP